LSSSCQQSGSPANDRVMITTGSVSSMPNCYANEGKNEKGRRCESGIALPQEAARSNHLEREVYAAKVGSQCQNTSLKLGWLARSDAQPTLQSCKIFHSRSNTDMAIHFSRPLSSGPFTRMMDDSNEGDCSFEWPPLVRKKSGELVRPALRLSPERRYNSVPRTPAGSRSGTSTTLILRLDTSSRSTVPWTSRLTHDL
jgi:hypothetical protein